MYNKRFSPLDKKTALPHGLEVMPGIDKDHIYVYLQMTRVVTLLFYFQPHSVGVQGLWNIWELMKGLLIPKTWKETYNVEVKSWLMKCLENIELH